MTAVEIFSLQLTSTLSDRSFESFSKQMGKHGRVVSCTVVGAPDVSQARGQVLVQAFIAKSAPQGTRIVQTLAIGYFYDGAFIPGGHGSMPFDSTDYLLVIVANSIATNRLAIQLGITEDEGGPTFWQLNVDHRTDGVVKRVAKSATAVGGATGLVLAVVPTNASWRWIAGRSIYTASATVGTRSVRYRWRDALGNTYLPGTLLAPTANQGAEKVLIPGIPINSTNALDLFPNIGDENPAPEARLPAGYDLFVLDNSNIDVADTATLDAQVEELIQI